MRPFAIQLDTQQPLYQQLYASLRQRIVRGELAPGDRLPPSRDLATALGVSRNVVVAAYDQLLAEGYVQARVGSGTWVSDDLPDRHLTAPATVQLQQQPEPPAAPQITSFARRALEAARRVAEDDPPASGSIDFAVDADLMDDSAQHAWQILQRHGAQQRPAVRPETAAGSARLRRALSNHLRQRRGIQADPQQILVLPGRLAAIDLILRALQLDEAPVLVEEPGDATLRRLIEVHGLAWIPAPVGPEGLGLPRPADLPRLPRLVHVMPSHQMPTGVGMSLQRRRELLEWAAGVDALVLEDDRGGEFSFDGRPLPAVQAFDNGGRTLYLGTFARLLPDDARLSYLVLPPTLVEPLVALRASLDDFVPVQTQLLLAEFLEGGHYSRHLRRLQQSLRNRRDILLAALERYFGGAIEVTGDGGGTHLLLRFPEPAPAFEDAWRLRLRQRGVIVRGLAEFSAAPSDHLGLVLGYAGLDENEIREGVRRIARDWLAQHQGTEELVSVAS